MKQGEEDDLETGHGNRLQDFCLANPMDGGAWRATVNRVAKSQTCLSTQGKACPLFPEVIKPIRYA